MNLPLISIGVIIMSCAAIIHGVVRRRRKPMWTLVFLAGVVVAISGLFTHTQAPQAEAGGTSQAQQGGPAGRSEVHHADGAADVSGFELATDLFATSSVRTPATASGTCTTPPERVAEEISGTISPNAECAA